MDWLEVHIDTNHAGLDPVSAMLSAQGVDGIVIDDETEFHEFLEGNRQYWDYVDEDLERRMAGLSRVTFYLPSDEEGFAKLGEVRIALEDLRAQGQDWGSLIMSLENLANEDWENNWKQYYKPIEIGRRLLVVPRWETVDPGSRVPLYLDPGLTFGTGDHATTRLCLTALEKLIHGGERVLDLGCGSGILSIAALKLGAASALAVDIDRMCQDVARENAALNGLGEETYRIRIGDVLADEAFRASLGGGYDVVLANIVADVIIGLAPLARSFLKPGGAFLCSGVIDGRQAEVEARLGQAGLTVLERCECKGWHAFLCR